MFLEFVVHYLRRWQVLIPMDRVKGHEVVNHSYKRDLRCFQPKQRDPQPFQVNRHCRLASKVMRHHSV